VGTRLNILGASGSGASTLGRLLASELALPYFDSDDYFHGHSDPPFCNPRGAAERYALLTADLDPEESWVLGGGVAGWTPYPELDFTLIVFLWVPTEVRMNRLRSRELERFGERIQPGGDMHAGHVEFAAWAERYDPGDVEGKTLPRHEAWLASQTCPVVECRGTESTRSMADRVFQFLAVAGSQGSSRISKRPKS